MGYIHDVDTDWGIFECDNLACLLQEGFEGTDQICRRMARQRGWKMRKSLDGPITLCPICSEELNQAEEEE